MALLAEMFGATVRLMASARMRAQLFRSDSVCPGELFFVMQALEVVLPLRLALRWVRSRGLQKKTTSVNHQRPGILCTHHARGKVCEEIEAAPLPSLCAEAAAHRGDL